MDDWAIDEYGVLGMGGVQMSNEEKELSSELFKLLSTSSALSRDEIEVVMEFVLIKNNANHRHTR